LHAKQYPSLMRHDVRTGHHPVLTPHAHLLVHLPPTVALSRMGDSLNGVSSRRLRRESPQLAQHNWGAKRPWAGSYSAGSIAGDPVSVLRAHVEQHCEPDSAHPRPEGRGTPAESR
jgi:putative transposase